MIRIAILLACAAALASARAAEIRAVVKDDKGVPIADAVVVARPEGALPRAPRARAEQVEQVDLEFLPKVKPILVGSAVSFPNRDNVRHHVYSFSAPKRFELPLYVGTPPQPVVFGQPGVVTIGCNIHDWMIGYIYVSESPHFAKSDAAGTAIIGDLAPGRYTVRVWHSRLVQAEAATAQVSEVGARGADVEWRLQLKPEVRVRRAPIAPGRAGRY